MGAGLKRVAALCGCLTATDGKTTVRYDSKGRKLGPYGCLCQTLRHRVVGDGCDMCNREKSKAARRQA